MAYKYPNFFEFSSQGYLTTFAARADIFQEAIDEMSRTGVQKATLNIYDFLAFGNYPNWLSFPVYFHQLDGKIMRDLLDTRTGICYLISQRTKEILEREGFSGWQSYPIKLFDKNNHEIEGYYGFSIVGNGGYAQKNENDRLLWDISNWDGSDFFRFDYYHHQVVTDKVMKVFKQEKISAVQFIPLERWVDIIYDNSFLRNNG